MKTLILVLLLNLSAIIAAQEFSSNEISDTLLFNYELFNNDEPLRIVLTSNFKKLKEEKETSKYQKAELHYFINDTLTVHHKIKLKARGKNRKATCHFPPLRLNLKSISKDNKNIRFYKLKMVVHCRTGSEYEKFILREFLCYKLYSILSDYSFKVRLLDVTYIDTGYKKPKETRKYAFLIENDEMMAERLNCTIDKNKQLTQRHIQQENIMNLAMFQFMIGNFDWGIPTQQNVKLIRPTSHIHNIYAVPYDFDYCGMVNANYAIPSKEMGISSVRQRLYFGECKPQEVFAPVIRKFKTHKPQFYKIISDFTFLDDKNKQNMIKYLDKFYKTIAHKSFYRNHIKPDCKQLGK